MIFFRNIFLLFFFMPFQPLFANDGKINVFVSILPQACFVERVGGEHVSVSVLVPPGQSPETFSPTPKQIIALQTADLYFKIGMQFEDVWLRRIQSSNTGMKIVDLREGIDLLHLDEVSVHVSDTNHSHDHHHGSEDPHIWLDPLRVIKQVETITNALIQENRDYQHPFQKHADVFTNELRKLHSEIESILQPIKQRIIALFHPSWGYFADRYGFKQIAIETNGKEPTAKQLAQVIQIIKEKEIRTIFVQEQLDSRMTATVAEQTGSIVIRIDPLAKDYINNLRQTALKMAEVLR